MVNLHCASEKIQITIQQKLNGVHRYLRLNPEMGATDNTDNDMWLVFIIYWQTFLAPIASLVGTQHIL